MNIRDAFSSSFKIIMTGISLCCLRPYLLFYKLIPIAIPVVLIFIADMHRMFDLVLHHKPIMASVFYALIGLNILFTVYLARHVLYLIYIKKEAKPQLVGHARLVMHTIFWAVLIIGGMFIFSRMTQLVYMSIKSPSITKYSESYTTLITHAVPSLMAVLALFWNFTALVPAIISTDTVSLYTAIKRSFSLICTNFITFIFIFLFFACLDLIPIAVPLAIPRQYLVTKQILPYCFQLLIATLNTITYCVFYSTHTTNLK